MHYNNCFLKELSTEDVQAASIAEIIPRAYRAADAYHDANRVREPMNYVTSKMRDMSNDTGCLGAIEEGSPALLLASTPHRLDLTDNVRIPTLRHITRPNVPHLHKHI